MLGRGAFGKVMLCQNKKNQKYYAIKSMRKEDLIEKEHLIKTKTERFLLEKCTPSPTQPNTPSLSNSSTPSRPRKRSSSS